MNETPKGPDSSGAPDSTQKFGPEFAQKLQGLESGVSLEEQEIIAALPSRSALLIVRKGPNAGARFLLDQDSTIAGRHPEADIFLDDVTVSRRHAEFVRHSSAFEVKDMGSLNGTYFDGNYSILTKMLGTDLDFQKVQNLLLGRPIDNLTKEVFIAEIAANLVQLKSKKQADIEKIFRFETGNYLLKEQFINQISKNRNVLVTYPSFTNQDNIFMPTGVSIIANQQNQVKINVANKKITFNESLSYPYSIPDGYSQIKID